MSDRHKYAINGGWFFENAQEHMEAEDFPRIPIGTIGGINGWYLTMKQHIIDNETNFFPCILTYEKKPMLKILKYFNIVKNDGSSDIPVEKFVHLKPIFGPVGRPNTVDEWLNEGFVMNGGIMIEYGLQIEGILDEDDIWTFNFYDPLYNCGKMNNMISFYKNVRNSEPKFLYCHKQLLIFHSTYFNSDSKKNQIIELAKELPMFFDHFLQLSHGVRLGAHRYFLCYFLNYAQKYKMFNVIQLLDQFIVSNSEWYSEALLSQAIYYDMQHCLANSLKEQKTSKKLAKNLKKMRINKMSGEAMKKCVKRFLEF